jgi:hypothetical protein
MATGSIVSGLQGEPRATHDIDLVVAITATRAAELLRSFPAPDYYVDEQAARDAVARRGMFNLLDVSGGDKVDFWVLTDDPYDRARFARRQAEQLPGLTLVVSSPEDTILQKLRWSELSGGSEKQYTDALRVYEVQSDRLDLDYMSHWAAAVGIQPLWDRLRAEARPL